MTVATCNTRFGVSNSDPQSVFGVVSPVDDFALTLVWLGGVVNASPWM